MTAPLLEPALPTSATDAATPDTGVPLGTLSDDMLGLPTTVGAQATGQMRGAMGAGPGMKAWGDAATEFG